MYKNHASPVGRGNHSGLPSQPGPLVLFEDCSWLIRWRFGHKAMIYSCFAGGPRFLYYRIGRRGVPTLLIIPAPQPMLRHPGEKRCGWQYCAPCAYLTVGVYTPAFPTQQYHTIRKILSVSPLSDPRILRNSPRYSFYNS